MGHLHRKIRCHACSKTVSFVCQIFTGVFTLEALIKIVALGLLGYLKNKWNLFDITIVLLSLIELGLQDVKGLSILRSFRLVCSLICFDRCIIVL